MLRRTFMLTALSALFVLGTSLNASAGTMLQFDQVDGSSGGSLSYDGAGGALVGTGIGFTAITATATPANVGVTAYLEATTLSFSTGANITEGPALWTFAGGGTFVLTGKVRKVSDDSFIVGSAVATDVILSGEFTGVQVAVGAGGSLSFIGFGFDDKNSDLLDFYGITSTEAFNFANSELAGSAVVAGDGGFTASVHTADLTNSVPEPGTIQLAMMGMAMLGGFGYSRRKKALKNAA